MIELMSAWNNESLFINPDQVLTVRSFKQLEWTGSANKYFHVAGYAKIEFAFGHEGEPFAEIVIGNVRDIAHAIEIAKNEARGLYA